MATTISLRLSEDESQMIQAYVAANNLNVSSFIRNLVLDTIEDELQINEERILKARRDLHNEKVYNHEEVWKELGI